MQIFEDKMKLVVVIFHIWICCCDVPDLNFYENELFVWRTHKWM